MTFDSVLMLLQQTQRQPTGSYSFIMIIGLFAIMYFILLRPQMKQQKEQKSMIEALKAGDKVITTGGVWGEIESVEQNRVKIKIADKVKIIVSRSAIAGHQAAQTAKDEGEKK